MCRVLDFPFVVGLLSLLWNRCVRIGACIFHVGLEVVHIASSALDHPGRPDFPFLRDAVVLVPIRSLSSESEAVLACAVVS